MTHAGLNGVRGLVALAMIVGLLQKETLSQVPQNSDCNLDEIKKELKKAEEKEAEAKRWSQDRNVSFTMANAELDGALKNMAEELMGVVSSSEFDQAKKKYYEALGAYDGAIDKYLEDTDSGVDHGKAYSELEAADAPRQKARDEMLALVKKAIEQDERWQAEREKEAKPVPVQVEKSTKFEELKNLPGKEKKDRPAEQEKGLKKLEDLPGYSRPKSKLERLQEIQKFFPGHEHYYDEASLELSSAQVDYKKAYSRKVALLAKLQEAEKNCGSTIDPCLVGTWECTSFKEANRFITGGGTGFRVTFKSDGTETVDYSTMKPIKASDDIVSYLGTASARISTRDGVAKIESIENAGASLNFVSRALHKEWKPKIPGLGPGGLGTTKGKNNYKCTEDSLEYQSSTPRTDADCTVKLTKVKP